MNETGVSRGEPGAGFLKRCVQRIGGGKGGFSRFPCHTRARCACSESPPAALVSPPPQAEGPAQADEKIGGLYLERLRSIYVSIDR